MSELLTRFRDGDAEAFREVVRANTPLVRAIASRFWKSTFEQEEAMQEVWTHVFTSRERFDPERAEQFRGWLAVLARNRCIHLLRKSGRAGSELGNAELEEIADTAANTARAAEDSDVRRAVEAFTSKLDPQWRVFFELHFVEGRDYDDICAHLKISKIRCKYMKKVLITRARKSRLLREALGFPEDR